MTIEPFDPTDDQPYTKCPYCDERIEPDETVAVYAVERRKVTASGPTYTWVDVIGGWFHEGCPPEAVGYARRPAPTPVS